MLFTLFRQERAIFFYMAFILQRSMGVLHMKSFERQQDIFMHESLFNVTNNSKQQFWRDIYKLPKISLNFLYDPRKSDK